ncbi:substrate-binding protein of ABC transporter, partial [mine drainage metagenome]
MRVVSVLPSATEIVFALGRGHELVGRSAECDYPAEVRSRPVVMHPRTLDSLAASGEIDARVTAARARGESLYRLDVDRLRELRPDLLLTQDLCGVCSVTGDRSSGPVGT